MNDKAIDLEVGGATLLAVPAVHFRLPFAEAVNALCRDPATRPDAIAVELGPAAAAAARAWLLEIGIGPSGQCRLPCMLALHRSRRLLHPSVRERAAALQRETGCELHRLPPNVLKEQLGFNGLAVLQLSPTDSIVEALRCSCELDVPIYGVDLEESADRDAAESRIEDPWLALSGVRAYAERNARRALADADALIDERREAVMAARLAAILARHRRVLFTGGLGHWTRLSALLRAPSRRPATVGVAPEEAEVASWGRTIVHPGIAVNHMEWPAVTWCWERYRPHPLRLAPVHDWGPPHHRALLTKALEHAYTRSPALVRRRAQTRRVGLRTLHPAVGGGVPTQPASGSESRLGAALWRSRSAEGRRAGAGRRPDALPMGQTHAVPGHRGPRSQQRQRTRRGDVDQARGTLSGRVSPRRSGRGAG